MSASKAVQDFYPFVTASLEVEYLKPTPLGPARGEVVAVRMPDSMMRKG
jgi:hypothetical protein